MQAILSQDNSMYINGLRSNPTRRCNADLASSNSFTGAGEVPEVEWL